MDNCLTVGDWVIIDGKVVGEVWSMHIPIDIIDVRVEWDIDSRAGFETVRTKHHEIIKITKEVADIMRGV